jgi:hypothetical protein
LLQKATLSSINEHNEQKDAYDEQKPWVEAMEYLFEVIIYEGR